MGSRLIKHNSDINDALYILDCLAASSCTASQHLECLVQFLEESVHLLACSFKTDSTPPISASEDEEHDTCSQQKLDTLDWAHCIRHLFSRCISYANVAQILIDTLHAEIMIHPQVGAVLSTAITPTSATSSATIKEACSFCTADMLLLVCIFSSCPSNQAPALHALLTCIKACRPMQLSGCIAELVPLFPETGTWLLELAMGWVVTGPPLSPESLHLVTPESNILKTTTTYSATEAPALLPDGIIHHKMGPTCMPAVAPELTNAVDISRSFLHSVVWSSANTFKQGVNQILEQLCNISSNQKPTTHGSMSSTTRTGSTGSGTSHCIGGLIQRVQVDHQILTDGLDGSISAKEKGGVHDHTALLCLPITANNTPVECLWSTLEGLLYETSLVLAVKQHGEALLQLYRHHDNKQHSYQRHLSVVDNMAKHLLVQLNTTATPDINVPSSADEALAALLDKAQIGGGDLERLLSVLQTEDGVGLPTTVLIPHLRIILDLEPQHVVRRFLRAVSPLLPYCHLLRQELVEAAGCLLPLQSTSLLDFGTFDCGILGNDSTASISGHKGHPPPVVLPAAAAAAAHGFSTQAAGGGHTPSVSLKGVHTPLAAAAAASPHRAAGCSNNQLNAEGRNAPSSPSSYSLGSSCPSMMTLASDSGAASRGSTRCHDPWPSTSSSYLPYSSPFCYHVASDGDHYDDACSNSFWQERWLAGTVPRDQERWLAGTVPRDQERWLAGTVPRDQERWLAGTVPRDQERWMAGTGPRDQERWLAGTVSSDQELFNMTEGNPERYNSTTRGAANAWGAVAGNNQRGLVDDGNAIKSSSHHLTSDLAGSKQQQALVVQQLLVVAEVVGAVIRSGLVNNSSSSSSQQTLWSSCCPPSSSLLPSAASPFAHFSSSKGSLSGSHGNEEEWLCDEGMPEEEDNEEIKVAQALMEKLLMLAIHCDVPPRPLVLVLPAVTLPKRSSSTKNDTQLVSSSAVLDQVLKTVSHWLEEGNLLLLPTADFGSKYNAVPLPPAAPACATQKDDGRQLAMTREDSMQYRAVQQLQQRNPAALAALLTALRDGCDVLPGRPTGSSKRAVALAAAAADAGWWSLPSSPRPAAAATLLSSWQRALMSTLHLRCSRTACTSSGVPQQQLQKESLVHYMSSSPSLLLRTSPSLEAGRKRQADVVPPLRRAPMRVICDHRDEEQVVLLVPDGAQKEYDIKATAAAAAAAAVLAVDTAHIINVETYCNNNQRQQQRRDVVPATTEQQAPATVAIVGVLPTITRALLRSLAFGGSYSGGHPAVTSTPQQPLLQQADGFTTSTRSLVLGSDGDLMSMLSQLLIDAIQPDSNYRHGTAAAATAHGSHGHYNDLSDPPTRLAMLSLFCEAVFTLPSSVLDCLFSILNQKLRSTGGSTSSTQGELSAYLALGTGTTSITLAAGQAAPSSAAAAASSCAHTSLLPLGPGTRQPSQQALETDGCWFPAPVVSPRDPRACLWFKKQQEVPSEEAAAANAVLLGPCSGGGRLAATAVVQPEEGSAGNAEGRLRGVESTPAGAIIPLINQDHAKDVHPPATIAAQQQLSLARQAVLCSLLRQAASAVSSQATSVVNGMMRTSDIKGGAEGLRNGRGEEPMPGANAGSTSNTMMPSSSLCRGIVSHDYPIQYNAAAEVGVALLEMYRCLLAVELSGYNRQGPGSVLLIHQPHLKATNSTRQQPDVAVAGGAVAVAGGAALSSSCDVRSVSLGIKGPPAHACVGTCHDSSRAEMVDMSRGVEEQQQQEEEEAPNARFCLRATTSKQTTRRSSNSAPKACTAAAQLLVPASDVAAQLPAPASDADAAHPHYALKDNKHGVRGGHYSDQGSQPIMGMPSSPPSECWLLSPQAEITLLRHLLLRLSKRHALPSADYSHITHHANVQHELVAPSSVPAAGSGGSDVTDDVISDRSRGSAAYMDGCTATSSLDCLLRTLEFLMKRIFQRISALAGSSTNFIPTVMPSYSRNQNKQQDVMGHGSTDPSYIEQLAGLTVQALKVCRRIMISCPQDAVHQNNPKSRSSRETVVAGADSHGNSSQALPSSAATTHKEEDSNSDRSIPTIMRRRSTRHSSGLSSVSTTLSQHPGLLVPTLWSGSSGSYGSHYSHHNSGASAHPSLPPVAGSSVRTNNGLHCRVGFSGMQCNDNNLLQLLWPLVTERDRLAGAVLGTGLSLLAKVLKLMALSGATSTDNRGIGSISRGGRTIFMPTSAPSGSVNPASVASWTEAAVNTSMRTSYLMPLLPQALQHELYDSPQEGILSQGGPCSHIESQTTPDEDLSSWNRLRSLVSELFPGTARSSQCMRAIRQLDPSVGRGSWTAAGKLGQSQEVAGAAVCLIMEVSDVMQMMHTGSRSGSGQPQSHDVVHCGEDHYSIFLQMLCGALECSLALINCTHVAAKELYAAPGRPPPSGCTAAAAAKQSDASLKHVALQAGGSHASAAAPQQSSSVSLSHLCVGLSKQILQAGPFSSLRDQVIGHAPTIPWNLLRTLVQLTMPQPETRMTGKPQDRAAASEQLLHKQGGVADKALSARIESYSRISGHLQAVPHDDHPHAGSSSLSHRGRHVILTQRGWEQLEERVDLAADLLYHLLPSPSLREPVSAARFMRLRTSNSSSVMATCTAAAVKVMPSYNAAHKASVSKTIAGPSAQHHLAERSRRQTAVPAASHSTAGQPSHRYQWMGTGGLLGVTEALRLAHHLIAPLTHALKMQFYAMEAVEETQDMVQTSHYEGAAVLAVLPSSSVWRCMNVGMRPEVLVRSVASSLSVSKLLLGEALRSNLPQISGGPGSGSSSIRPLSPHNLPVASAWRRQALLRDSVSSLYYSIQVCYNALICIGRFVRSLKVAEGSQEQLESRPSRPQAGTPQLPPSFISCLIALGAACSDVALELVEQLKSLANETSAAAAAPGSYSSMMMGANTTGAAAWPQVSPRTSVVPSAASEIGRQLLVANRSSLKLLRRSALLFVGHRGSVLADAEAVVAEADSATSATATSRIEVKAARGSSPKSQGGSKRVHPEEVGSQNESQIMYGRLASRLLLQLRVAEGHAKHESLPGVNVSAPARGGETLSSPNPHHEQAGKSSSHLPLSHHLPISRQPISNGNTQFHEDESQYMGVYGSDEADIDGDPLDLLEGFEDDLEADVEEEEEKEEEELEMEDEDSLLLNHKALRQELHMGGKAAASASTMYKGVDQVMGGKAAASASTMYKGVDQVMGGKAAASASTMYKGVDQVMGGKAAASTSAMNKGVDQVMGGKAAASTSAMNKGVDQVMGGKAAASTSAMNKGVDQVMGGKAAASASTMYKGVDPFAKKGGSSCRRVTFELSESGKKQVKSESREATKKIIAVKAPAREGAKMISDIRGSCPSILSMPSNKKGGKAQPVCLPEQQESSDAEEAKDKVQQWKKPAAIKQGQLHVNAMPSSIILTPQLQAKVRLTDGIHNPSRVTTSSEQNKHEETKSLKGSAAAAASAGREAAAAAGARIHTSTSMPLTRPLMPLPAAQLTKTAAAQKRMLRNQLLESRLTRGSSGTCLPKHLSSAAVDKSCWQHAPVEAEPTLNANLRKRKLGSSLPSSAVIRMDSPMLPALASMAVAAGSRGHSVAEECLGEAQAAPISSEREKRRKLQRCHNAAAAAAAPPPPPIAPPSGGSATYSGFGLQSKAKLLGTVHSPAAAATAAAAAASTKSRNLQQASQQDVVKPRQAVSKSKALISSDYRCLQPPHSRATADSGSHHSKVVTVASNAMIQVSPPSLAHPPKAKKKQAPNMNCAPVSNVKRKGGATVHSSQRRQSRNPYVSACVKELDRAAPDSDEEDNSAAEDSGWSDLEDFIVCKPERDYSQLFDKRFGYKGGSSRVPLDD
ncbi:hypothetical protein CEUSTIGMA_g2662.t1 [Chlamydomonas eustigma]|uniref:Uncharacterized protein n=1 Tax=Chlamydomonas eustigma TaxID=1157962 RepID=A0A250WWK4_9CHLO|nr:hypothetical protein CEUSTIGMA_g2662.t1 [Chlamydomonas eustigma]|eukprot:GAX75218.1 hypothetical protein CEUSTIGMA_g2662.t1 [Chlamydomonas eustigma]